MKKNILSVLFAFWTFLLYAEDMPTITIVYNENTATVTIPSDIKNVTSSVTGAQVVVSSTESNKEYCYKVSGKSTNGSLTINGSYKFTLELAGVDLKSTTSPALYVNCGKRIAVVLDEGTVNTFEDSKGSGKMACMYFTGHPEFEGSGTLNVTGNTNHAISAKEYLEIKDNVGTINILSAVKDGIHCGKGKQNNANNYFYMKGGTINIKNVLGDGIDSDDFGVMKISGGEINLEVSADGGRGMKCDSTFTMKGGTINATLKGGTLIEDNDTSRCMALNVGLDFKMSGGKINVNRVNDKSKAYKIKGEQTITDGVIQILGNHYAVSPNDYQYDMSVYAAVKINDNLRNDYSNYHVAAYSGNECRGNGVIYTTKGNLSYVQLRTYSNIASNEPISFRIYDASTDRQAIADNEITFVNDGTTGTPSAPFNIVVNSFSDINKDGQISISDISSLIDILNNANNLPAADVNNDSKSNLDDVSKLVEVLKSKK